MLLVVKTMEFWLIIFYTGQVVQLVQNIATTVDQEQTNMDDYQLNPKVVQS